MIKYQLDVNRQGQKSNLDSHRSKRQRTKQALLLFCGNPPHSVLRLIYGERRQSVSNVGTAPGAAGEEHSAQGGIMDVAAPTLRPALLPPARLYDEPLESLLEPIGFQPQEDRENLALAARSWQAAAALKLSILLTVHNREATIAQAISGILNVDYPCAVELIVVDDGSTDGT